jgi:GGDEF domain-containing protein
MEFFNLLAELNTLLGTDRSYQEFLQAGESLGVSHEELLKELQENPRQAAQLILLASEARRSNREGSAEELINSLADFVEKAGEAAGVHIQSNPREAAKLGSMLQQMEAEVNQKLKEKGLPEEMRAMGQQKLRLRMQHSVFDLKGKAAMAQMQAANVSDSEKVQFMLEMFGDEREMDAVIGRAHEGLDAEALAREAGNQVMQKVRQEMNARREKAASKDLPAGVYVKAVLDFFVKSEISRASRYNQLFSALLISFQGLPEEKGSLEAQGDALRGLQNVLVGDLRRNLRETDFVGYLGFNRFLVVLPMTDIGAVPVILRKLQEQLARQVALPDGTRLSLRPRVGVAGYDKEKTGTYPKLYAELVKSWQSAG